MAKKLVKGEKMVFGVCSGLATYFDMDITVMRAIFVAGFLFFGVGLIFYIILAFIMPVR